MEHRIHVTFPNDSQVSATVGNHLILAENPSVVDQPQHPSPFELFLASVATCAASYAKTFCQARSIPTDTLNLEMLYDRSPEKPMIEKVELCLTVPDNFPEKYRKGIVKAIDLCMVKKHLVDTTEFEVTLK